MTPFKVITDFGTNRKLILTYLLPCTVSNYGWFLVKFSLARGECLTLTLSLEVIPSSIAKNDMSRKTIHSLAYTFFAAEIFNHVYVMRPENYRIRWNNANLGLLRRLRSFKVTEFGTNRKLICHFLLVIHSDIHHILLHFGDLAFERSKIFGYHSCV